MATTAGPRASNHSGTISTVTTETAAFEQPFELVDLDRYVVYKDGPVGHVEVVHPVFVCYLGHPFHRAVEVAQVYDFEYAVALVASTAEGSRRRCHIQ